MFKRFLTYFLLTVLFLQSSVAMADAHQSHQSGTEHLVFDDSHQHDTQHISDNSHENFKQNTADTSDNLDCHHCCHCHVHLCPAAIISSLGALLSKHSSPIPDYLENTFPETFESFLRPPKA